MCNRPTTSLMQLPSAMAKKAKKKGETERTEAQGQKPVEKEWQSKASSSKCQSEAKEEQRVNVTGGKNEIQGKTKDKETVRRESHKTVASGKSSSKPQEEKPSDDEGIQIMNHKRVKITEGRRNVTGKRIMMGDFNCMRKAEERIGGTYGISPDTEFNKMIETNKLWEMKVNGGRFTWSNKQLGDMRILSRIDRIMVNEEWLQKFPEAYANVLPAGISDRNAFLIRWGDQVYASRNGYNSGFYKKAWSIVEEDVCDVVLEFFKTGRRSSPSYRETMMNGKWDPEFNSFEDEEEIDILDDDVMFDLGGSIPKAITSDRVEEQLARFWKDVLVVRLIGKTVKNFEAFKRRLRSLWWSTKGFSTLDQQNGYHLSPIKGSETKLEQRISVAGDGVPTSGTKDHGEPHLGEWVYAKTRRARPLQQGAQAQVGKFSTSRNNSGSRFDMLSNLEETDIDLPGKVAGNLEERINPDKTRFKNQSESQLGPMRLKLHEGVPEEYEWKSKEEAEGSQRSHYQWDKARSDNFIDENGKEPRPPDDDEGGLGPRMTQDDDQEPNQIPEERCVMDEDTDKSSVSPISN
ncbi:OLC1v1007905C1 [Oldenlandia corymbosa var. corymbosa]|uniref:OLC1v1007905C1 n=1 Tax=Oldenlandia corymbosa var. corymbosa TaxID=529605 RepID=A0AAV1DKJ2_OLDCO|nr:OLC1v1007905C1 [Oldenlandia corymbosa var. corymbosa]